jgi:hypothetical protein
LGLAGILWDFNRFKDDRRITLRQNPQFYFDLPTSVEAYGCEFKADSFETFGGLKLIYVLIDGPKRVVLETGQGTRIFGNVYYMPKGVMVFKGSYDISFLLYLRLTSH